MASDFTISKVRFFEYGKPAPANSRFKGILDEQSLIGYYHYTEEKDKNDRNKEIDNIHDGGYLGYVSKDEYTFTSEGSGWLKNENAKHFEDALASLFKKMVTYGGKRLFHLAVKKFQDHMDLNR
ncbi:hypothetical protein SD457_12665 [Coprobacillaceae bacterium CR2/5/TPMF4]|nr:hypothetical protein SD457_12665 [Coprobacillaceae bacterium CR2/5/TPMF4]